MWLMKSVNQELLHKEVDKELDFSLFYMVLEEALLFIDMTGLVLH